MRITDDNVRGAIKYACEQTGRTEAYYMITWEWSSRLRTTMGLAIMKGSRGDLSLHMKLSDYIFSNSSEQEQLKTVVHEACHLIDRYELVYKNVLTTGKHGHNWKRLMRMCGLKPERCHRNPVKKNSKQKRYPVNCGCMVHEVSGVRMARMAKGYVYSCKHCKTRLQPDPLELVQFHLRKYK